MSTFSALYCVITNTLLECRIDGAAVRTPRTDSETEYWCDQWGWSSMAFGEHPVYTGTHESCVPELVRFAQMMNPC